MVKKLFFLSIMAFGTSAQAIIITGGVTSGGGAFEELSLPFDPPNGALNEVGADTFQTSNLYAFNEAQNLTLMQNYTVNIGSDLTTGMTVASHYVFFDPLNFENQKGWVEFDADILAIITSKPLLDASDSLFNNNVDYLSPSLRGLEYNDSVWIGTGSETNRMYVDWFAKSPGDFVRVITRYSNGGNNPCSNNPPGVGGCPATVPEPSPLALFFLGALGLTVSAKLKARKRV